MSCAATAVSKAWIFFVLVLVTVPRETVGSAFRGSSLDAAMSTMRVEDVRAAMLEELLSSLGHSSRVTEQRLEVIEDALRPTFLAMPKNENGNLEHASVRYVLHRFFVQRHGIFMKGLEPWGEAWNSSAATEILEDRVPSFVQNLFEERLFGRGLGLHELAILAATLEHLIHDDAMSRLKAAYQVHELSFSQPLPLEDVADVIDSYMIFFLRGADKVKTPMDLYSYKARIASEYPGWHDSQKFTRKVQQEVVDVKMGTHSGFSSGGLTFNATIHLVEEIGDRYGPWQDLECRDLKATLAKIERPGTGRVPLTDFYGHALSGAWQFTESVPYLRELGALDEVSDPARPSVIIPNYVNAHSNCLGASSMYSICCLNECEPLLAHLEREISEPQASPERIVELVSVLSSTTVTAPRVLPEALQSRLLEVAKHHGGHVPLHGRLFAQWMHHAYPQECPYPHVSGTTTPMTPAERHNGSTPMLASLEDMAKHVEEAASLSTSTMLEMKDMALGESMDLHWSAEEELVASTVRPDRARRELTGAKVIFWALVLLCAAASLWQPLATLRSAICSLDAPSDKHSLPFTTVSHGRVKAHWC